MPLDFEFVSGFASAIAPILDESITGPYRVIHHALFPFVAIAPSTDDTPVTIMPGPCMYLDGKQVVVLNGLDDRRYFAVQLLGQSGADLYDITEDRIFKNRAQRALSSVDHPRALSGQRSEDLQKGRDQLIVTLQHVVEIGSMIERGQNPFRG